MASWSPPLLGALNPSPGSAQGQPTARGGGRGLARPAPGLQPAWSSPGSNVLTAAPEGTVEASAAAAAAEAALWGEIGRAESPTVKSLMQTAAAVASPGSDSSAAALPWVARDGSPLLVAAPALPGSGGSPVPMIAPGLQLHAAGGGGGGGGGAGGDTVPTVLATPSPNRVPSTIMADYEYDPADVARQQRVRRSALSSHAHTHTHTWNAHPQCTCSNVLHRPPCFE